MAKVGDGLNEKQLRFAQEYIVDLNATKAAIRAGYSENTAKQQGSRLLTNVDVQAVIAAGKGERSETTKVNAEWVLTRLTEEAVADVSDIYEENGNLKSVHDWPLIWRQGLAGSIETKEEFETVDGEKKSIGYVTKIKTPDRIKRLELIGKHVDVQAFLERMKHEGEIEMPSDVTILEKVRTIAAALAKAQDVKDKSGG